MKPHLIGVALLLWSVTAAGQSHTTCSGPQLGTWKLKSATMTYVDTGETVKPFGPHPTGYLHYEADCRMYVIIVPADRKGPATTVPTDAEKVGLFNSFVAYAGTWTTDGDKVSHHVDVSWIESWTSTTQVRQFKIDGTTLHLQSMPAKNGRDGKVSSSTLVWTKVE